ncbi:hypothetical protein GCM10023148_12710 [Actinokineospora soli]
MRSLGGPGPRCLAAAGVACAVVLAWWAILSTWPEAVFTLVGADDVSCPEAQGWGCEIGAAFLSVILGVTLIISSGVGLVWWGLSLVGVRPAWPVALLGPVFTLFAVWVGDKALGELGALGSALVPVAAGYALAALVTARVPGPPRVRG